MKKSVLKPLKIKLKIYYSGCTAAQWHPNDMDNNTNYYMYEIMRS